jgi:hypothetical protein
MDVVVDDLDDRDVTQDRQGEGDEQNGGAYCDPDGA